jgi:hypothetical protein
MHSAAAPLARARARNPAPRVHSGQHSCIGTRVLSRLFSLQDRTCKFAHTRVPPRSRPCRARGADARVHACRPRGCLRALLLVAALARAAGDGDGLFACCTAAPAAAGDCTPSRGTPNDPVQCAALGELFNNDWAAVQGWVDPTAALGWESAALGYATDFCSFPGVVCDDGGNVTQL